MISQTPYESRPYRSPWSPGRPWRCQQGIRPLQTHDSRESEQFMTETGCNIFPALNQKSELSVGQQGNTEAQDVPVFSSQYDEASVTNFNKHIDFNIHSDLNGVKPKSRSSRETESNDDDCLKRPVGPSRYLHFIYYPNHEKSVDNMNDSINCELATEQIQMSHTSDRPYSLKSHHMHNSSEYPRYKYQSYFQRYNHARELLDPEDSLIYFDSFWDYSCSKESMYGEERGSLAYTGNTEIKCKDVQCYYPSPIKSDPNGEVMFPARSPVSPISPPIKYEPFYNNAEIFSQTDVYSVDEHPQALSNQPRTQRVYTQSDELDTGDMLRQQTDTMSYPNAMHPLNPSNAQESNDLARGTFKLPPERQNREIRENREEPIYNEDLDKYYTSTDGKTFVCNYPDCGNCFPSPYRVRSHILSHMQVRQFMCGTCNRKYVRSHDLKRHLRQHDKSYMKTTESNKKFRVMGHSTRKWLEYMIHSDTGSSPATQKDVVN